MNLLDLFVGGLMVTGVFFFAVGTIGLWRFPDVYSRAHATTKCDTLGAGLILLGLALRLGLNTATLRLVFIVALVWFTNATAAHVIGRSAYRMKYPLASGTFSWTYQGGGEDGNA